MIIRSEGALVSTQSLLICQERAYAVANGISDGVQRGNKVDAEITWCWMSGESAWNHGETFESIGCSPPLGLHTASAVPEQYRQVVPHWNVLVYCDIGAWLKYNPSSFISSMSFKGGGEFVTSNSLHTRLLCWKSSGGEVRIDT